MKKEYRFLRLWRWAPIAVFLGTIYSAGALFYLISRIRKLVKESESRPLATGRTRGTARLAQGEGIKVRLQEGV